MEREYTINQFLHEQGFHVPRMLYLNPREHLIFRDFVEGKNFVSVIKRVVSSKKAAVEELSLLREVGGKIAEIHKLEIALGDCKPENIIVTGDRELYFIDLEQN